MARELYEVEGIDLSGLSYSPRKYIEDEQNIIKPQLEALGYTGITFSMGESDSFGPLSRKVHTDQEEFWYG